MQTNQAPLPRLWEDDQSSLSRRAVLRRSSAWSGGDSSSDADSGLQPAAAGLPFGTTRACLGDSFRAATDPCLLPDTSASETRARCCQRGVCRAAQPPRRNFGRRTSGGRRVSRGEPSCGSLWRQQLTLVGETAAYPSGRDSYHRPCHPHGESATVSAAPQTATHISLQTAREEAARWRVCTRTIKLPHGLGIAYPGLDRMSAAPDLRPSGGARRGRGHRRGQKSLGVLPEDGRLLQTVHGPVRFGPLAAPGPLGTARGCR